MYLDSIGQPIGLNDYVVYAKSNYARIAKIVGLAQHYGPGLWGEITLMTVSRTKSYLRKFTFTGNKVFSVIRIDDPPIAEVNIIEERLSK